APEASANARAPEAVAHRPTGALRAPEDGVVALPRGELEHGGDVIGFEIGIVGENLGSIRPGRQEIQHIFHTNAHATDGRPAAADMRVDGNAVDLGHRWVSNQVISEPGGSVGSSERGFSSPSKRPR